MAFLTWVVQDRPYVHGLGNTKGTSSKALTNTHYPYIFWINTIKTPSGLRLLDLEVMGEDSDLGGGFEDSVGEKTLGSIGCELTKGFKCRARCSDPM